MSFGARPACRLRAGLSLALLPLLFAAPARAQDLMELLANGPVATIQSSAQGKFERATAVIDIQATPAEVWRTATDFASYRYFLPKVVKSDVLSSTPTQVQVKLEVDVPISNAKYTFRYDLDPAAFKLHGEWVKGDLKGTFCDWRIVSYKDRTLLYYTTSIRGLSGLATTFEDDQQTITVGVNVVTALAVVKAVKRRVEMTASATPAPAPTP